MAGKSRTEENLGELAGQVEDCNVHRVYEEIAGHFSNTRHSPWPNVSEFINSFPTGSILCDIGCGNGKYLTSRNSLQIGCDRSNSLLKICIERRANVFRCDCLRLAFRSNSADGCINIAVIHHLATEERRIESIREMTRILRTGGRGLIYVWAKNQMKESIKSKYLSDRKMKSQPSSEEQFPTNVSPVDLPIHTNRTEFQQQDILVPWKLKSPSTSETTLFRFYHVFEVNELESLCSQVTDIEIIKSYYDEGNHCVIFKKI